MNFAPVFGDHMVLQRGKPVLFFGTGEGEATISFLGEERHTIAKDGKWEIAFPIITAGGPYTVEATLNDKKITFTDVYSGEVFLCGGQSNMSLPLTLTHETAEYDEHIRIFDSNIEYPKKDYWFIPEEKERAYTSALALHFAGMMYQRYRVPIGILSINQGASRMESWLPKGTPGVEIPHEPGYYGDDGDCPFNDWGYLFEHQTSHVIPYPIRAILWYQGESDSFNYEIYRYCFLLKTLIADFRDKFRDKDLPFLLTQVAPYIFQTKEHDECAAVRQGQQLISQSVPNVHMITIGDLGEFGNIHPFRKRAVAERFFRAVRREVFGEVAPEYCGPTFQKMEVNENGDAIITFNHDNGLFCEDETVFDIMVCDRLNSGEQGEYFIKHPAIVKDEQFVPAEGKLVDGKLLIHKDGMQIKEVKYCYHATARPNLFNADGLPAAGFRATVDGLCDPVCTIF